MRRVRTVFLLATLSLAACAAAPSPPPAPAAIDRATTEAAIVQTLDDFHDAAAKADEPRYFAHFADDGVFLGTDATERWDVAAFRAYAHPHFAKGKAWTMRATRRAITVASDGRTAWFDEDLATERLGPARGSGVLVSRDGAWKIAQYNLAITVPNERFADVRALLERAPAAPH
jgi:hypothetical protein